MLDAAAILNGLPPNLRTELLEAYEAISRNYAEHKWRESELDGGQFCEIVYSIIHGLLIGPMPSKAYKPSNMLQASRDLEKNTNKTPSRIGDHSLRILIPRMLPALYDIRNNRNVGHVGGDVNPNFLDATAVYGMASWILAELIRIFHSISTQEAQQVVDALIERKHPIIWEVGNMRRVLNPKMKPRNKTLVLLHGKPGWVDAKQLHSWVEYSTISNFRSQILAPLHNQGLIEFDRASDRAHLSPLGAQEVEDNILAIRTLAK
ncbi:MAG TPA: hypothetical protein VGH23_03305 [Rhizomicrobium sp.]|jgi:hypothetical protein